MYSELSLLVELYNPLYLFPIFGVVFTAFMVYAFGFKSSTQPPTEVFDALNDRHPKNYKTHESVKKKKQNQKITTKSDSKTDSANGHIPSAKTAEKKAAKKVEVESKAVPETKAKPIAKKSQKNKKSEDVDNRQDVDDKDSGEWVELISKKEKKNRKQKEEQLLIESKTKVDKSSDKSPKKSSKKNKTQKNIDSDSNAKTVSKPIKESVEKEKNDLNSAKTQNGIQSEELVAEEPDIYELAKEQRLPKKSQKHRNQKRNSESEMTPKVEPTLEAEPKPNLNLVDKLTASIVANYEANDKTDSSNTSNKKKKEKNKKKQTNNESTDKQVIKKEEKVVSIETNGTPIEKSSNSANVVDIPTETIKASEEEEFKSVGKKRRARRE